MKAEKKIINQKMAVLELGQALGNITRSVSAARRVENALL
jgi:hypothetical protein